MNRREAIRLLGSAICAGAVPQFLPSLLPSGNGYFYGPRFQAACIPTLTTDDPRYKIIFTPQPGPPSYWTLVPS